MSRLLSAVELEDQALFRQNCYINGLWCAADNANSLEVTDPSNGAVIGTVPQMGSAEARRAIAAANVALSGWRALAAKERSGIVHRWYELMLANEKDLAMLMTREQGKPLAESRAEIAYAASFLQWFSEEAKRVYGETIPGHQIDKRIIVTKEPIGVCAAITPWNFPSAMITRKAGPALAAGCTMVLKPATATPFSALALAELAERAGVPAGVFNVITGSASSIGGEMTSNPLVRKVTFTGSTEIGKVLLRQCAETVKKTSMELGGNAPFIVFDDADLDAAVEGVISSKYRNAGQTCVCANRLLVQHGIYDEFATRLAARVAQLKVGDGREPGVTLGPLIDPKAVAKTQEHVDDAVAKGARVILGGKPHPLGPCYFEPTVLINATPDMKVAREETFGPVAALFRFHEDSEAIAMANDTEFGLASYFFSRDISRVWRVAEGLEYGIVGINTGLISTEVAPFGGVKESGLGREGSHYGIEDYLELKYICMSI